jgi:hypothetical protein
MVLDESQLEGIAIWLMYRPANSSISLMFCLPCLMVHNESTLTWYTFLSTTCTQSTHILRTQLHQKATVQSLLKMSDWRPKHVEALTLNKKLRKEYQVGVDSLTLKSLPVTLLTTMFNIQEFYMVITLSLCVLYESQNKQQSFPYTTFTDWIL